MKNQVIIQEIVDYLSTFNEMEILVLNGSMADPNVSKDEYQDIDLSLLSSNLTSTMQIIKEFKLFNNRILFTEKHEGDPFVHSGLRFLLHSGIEVGFNIYYNLEIFNKEINRFVVLLFNNLGKPIDFSPPTDRPFQVNKPTIEEFNQLMTDIYWATADVMKGFKRDHFIYTKHKYDTVLQPKIKHLITWYIRDLNDWNVSLGSHGKRIKEYLEPGIYEQYVSTYSTNTLDGVFEKLLNAKKTVTEIGNKLADSLGYRFPEDQDQKMFEYLKSTYNK